MAQESEKPKKEGGLWIPNRIRSISRSVLGDSEKMLLAEIYSFGDKGFYKSNETIAKEYMASERTVSRWVTRIITGEFVYVKNPKGYYRTLWAKLHPSVQEAAKLWYRNKEIPKTDCKPVRQNCLTKLDKISEVTATNSVSRLSQKCPSTYKKTNTETNKRINAGDLPLPAGGQTSQLLEDRKAGVVVQVEKLKKSFGSDRGRRTPELTAAEHEQRRQAQLKALWAVEAGEKAKKSKLIC
ncbi:MAG: helix-turn-helix domain-containing protein [Planctomycetes bacterium]|nr:helix-turn-helix domain-containing protein [Planctomycetota bacterium]